MPPTNRIADLWSDPESDRAVQQAEQPAPASEPRWERVTYDEVAAITGRRAPEDVLAGVLVLALLAGTVGFVAGWVGHGMVQ